MVKKSIHLGHYTIPALLALCTAVGMLVGYRLDEEQLTPGRDAVTVDSISDVNHGRIEEILRYIDARYVDNLDKKQLNDRTVDFILQQLDPFSSYISPEYLQRYEEIISGKQQGLGVELQKIKDEVFIVYVYPDSPAEKAGLAAGQRILEVNDHDVAEDSVTMKEISILMDAIPEQVTLKIQKEEEIYDVVIEKAEINVNSVDAYFTIQDTIGYVKLTSFTNKSYKEFMTALENLGAGEQLNDVIIDLRSNRGGVLRESVKILQQLFENGGQVLVYTEGDKNRKQEYKTTGKPFYRFDKIVVLVNEWSASASEVVAGAIQDTDRGLVIGTSSYGKGLVQEHYSLKEGGELRLTVARYYTPSGRLIQKPYALLESEQITAKDSTDYYSTNGRALTAEGGIVPDITVNNTHVDDWESLPVELYHLSLKKAIAYAENNATEKDVSHDVEQFITELNEQTIADNLPQDLKNTFYQFSVFNVLKMKYGLNVAWEETFKSEDLYEEAMSYINHNGLLTSYLTPRENE